MSDLRDVTSWLLLFSAIALLLVMLHAWRGTIGLERSLRGKRGHALTKVIASSVGLVALSQVGSVINASLILYDSASTIDIRIAVFFTQNLILTAAVISAFHGAGNIARRRLGDEAIGKYDVGSDPSGVED